MRLTKKKPLSLAHVGCILSPETLLAGDSQRLLASANFFWFGAILAPMTVLTGSFPGIAATNQCFSSRPHKNFCLARSSSCASNWRLSKTRCFSRGCKFRTSISCLLPGAVRISKNSPALSRRMWMTICGGCFVDPVLFQRMRRGEGAASITFTRAPIREKNRSKLLPTAFSFLRLREAVGIVFQRKWKALRPEPLLADANFVTDRFMTASLRCFRKCKLRESLDGNNRSGTLGARSTELLAPNWTSWDSNPRPPA